MRQFFMTATALLVAATFSSTVQSQSSESETQAAASALLESVQSARGLSNAPIKDGSGGGTPPTDGGGGGGDNGGGDNEAQAAAFFEDNVHDLIYPKCYSACHQSGGIAPGQGADLVFVGPGPNQISDNYDELVRYITSGGGANLLLSKIAGNSHTGGIQYTTGSSEYQTIEEFTEFFD